MSVRVSECHFACWLLVDSKITGSPIMRERERGGGGVKIVGGLSAD
jgi:hypothetical protein